MSPAPGKRIDASRDLVQKVFFMAMANNREHKQATSGAVFGPSVICQEKEEGEVKHHLATLRHQIRDH